MTLTKADAADSVLWVRLPRALKQDVETEAARNDRTVTSMARILLGEALDARKATSRG